MFIQKRSQRNVQIFIYPQSKYHVLDLLKDYQGHVRIWVYIWNQSQFRSQVKLVHGHVDLMLEKNGL